MKDNQSRNSTITIIVMCAIVFLVFTFCYIYLYQAESLAYLQHTLSQGKTHYERTIGAVIITTLAVLLQYAVFRITGLRKRGHALTYFPSVLGLTVLTDVRACGYVSHFWIWLAPLLLVAWAALAWVFKQFETYEPGKDNPGIFSRIMWINLLSMAAMLVFMITCSNSNEVLHHRLRIENMVVKAKYEKALEVGRKSLENDSSLTMLRFYALARAGKAGEEFFKYPVSDGKSALLLPDGQSTKTLMMNPKIIKAFSQKKGRADYQLMGYLLDRDLDGFAKTVGQYYDTDSTAIPRHYREALVLYTHLRQHRVLTYHDAVLDADYEDMKKLLKKIPDRAQRESAVRDTYGNTYWCYYFRREG